MESISKVGQLELLLPTPCWRQWPGTGCLVKCYGDGVFPAWLAGKLIFNRADLLSQRHPLSDELHGLTGEHHDNQ